MKRDTLLTEADNRHKDFRPLNRRDGFLSGFIRIFCAVVVLGMIVFSINGFFSQGVKFGLIMVAGLLFLAPALFFLIFKLSDSKYVLFWSIIILIGIILRIVYSFTVDADLVSDQQRCLRVAQLAVNGDFSWATSERYFVLWAYQIPFVLYESFILKIFGTVRALYVFNGLFSVVTCVLIYLIIKKLYQKNTALIATALFSCFPLFIFSISRLYNQIIAGVFLLLAIYFFVDVCKQPFVCATKKDYVKRIVLCGLTGLFFGLSNVFRPEAIVGVLAVAAWFLYGFIKNINKQNVCRLLLFTIFGIFTAYLAYKLINLGVGAAVIFSGISPNGIGNGCVLWSIVCGMTPDNYGGYSTTYSYILNYDGVDRQFEVFKSIMNDIFSKQGLGDIAKFFVMKEYKMWGEIYNFSELNNVPSIIKLLLTNLNHGVYIISMVLSLIGLRKKRFNPSTAFLSILFLGFFMALVIKSIENTYRYSPVLILILLSAGGIDYLTGEINIVKRIRERKTRNLSIKTK